MSYAYVFLNLPTDLQPGPDLADHIGDRAWPFGDDAQVRATLSSIRDDILWSHFNDTWFGSIGPRNRAEFTVSDCGVLYHGPAEWIAKFCAGTGWHCWNPQTSEVWCPDGSHLNFA